MLRHGSPRSPTDARPRRAPLGGGPVRGGPLRGVLARGSRLACAAGLACLAGWVGCAAAPPDYGTRLEPATAPRRPPGVALERPFAPPTLASHDERTDVLLPPLDVSQARSLLNAFLVAVLAEDAETLEALLAPGAVQQLSSGRDFRSARDYWRRRLARLDYDALAVTSLYRPQDVQVRRTDDATSFLAPADDERHRPRHPRELALTVRPLTTHAGNTRLFGPELTFVIVDDGDGLVIARILEDFQLL